MLRVNDSSFQADLKGRFFLVSALVILLFGAVLVRIWYLQIFQGKNFQRFANQNSIELLKIPAMRGRILDRNGTIIADSRASFDLRLTPEDVEEDVESTLLKLSRIFAWEEGDLSKIRAKLAVNGRYDATVIKRDMSKDELAQILARQYAFPGVDVMHSPARAYPFGDHGSHLLGYLGEINKRELQLIKDSGETLYDLGDVWGIAGVEKRFDKPLRGENGNEPVVQDAHGRRVEMEISKDLLPAFQPREPVRGKDLVLALDAKVQEAAEDAFTGASGGVVAIDPRNGDVLALLSRPEFRPEKFARGVSSDYWGELTEDPLNPLYDRALRGLYPPGSTFKFVVATAALTEKVTNAEEKVFCPGHYQLGRETKHCWKKEGHGWMNLHDAIKQSCDVYFYEMGRRLGVDRIAKYAKGFGMGERTGIGINREEDGLVPTEAWKRKIYRQPWVGGETLSVAIGQGFLQITPIQMTVALASVVNGGKVFQPRLVLKTQNEDGTVVDSFPVTERRRIEIDPEITAAVRHGMDAVVNEPGGTAYFAARSQTVRIGGKTGTAQVVGKGALKQLGDHAWFIAFAPVEDPKIVVTVIVEHGGHGGTAAAPIAKKMIEAYLGDELKRSFDHRFIDHFDWPLFGCMSGILALGLVNLYSATYEMPIANHFRLQLVWGLIGMVGLFVLLFFDYRILERVAYVVYALALVLLFLVLIKGRSALGAQRWLQVGRLSIQPSELIKPAMVIVLAKFFHSRRDQRPMGFATFLLPAILAGLPAAMILKQPDLGTAIIVVCVAGAMILFAGVQKKLMLAGVLVGLVAVPLVWHFGLHDYQKNRVLTFLNPEKDAKGKGYQIIQSRIAIGSGELTGKGYLKGTQTKLQFLPKQHTDFAFSTFAEEFGFLGSLFVILLYASLTVLGINVAQTAKERFGMMLAFGMTALVGSQACINLAMEAGMLPVVGVPLPLFSYGGTSLLSTLMAIGVLLNISMRRFLF